MEVTVQLHAPAALPPRKAVGTHGIEGFVMLSTGVDILEKPSSFYPWKESNQD
jgi:hypothetical protein